MCVIILALKVSRLKYSHIQALSGLLGLIRYKVPIATILTSDFSGQWLRQGLPYEECSLRAGSSHTQDLAAQVITVVAEFESCNESSLSCSLDDIRLPLGIPLLRLRGSNGRSLPT